MSAESAFQIHVANACGGEPDVVVRGQWMKNSSNIIPLLKYYITAAVAWGSLAIRLPARQTFLS